MPDIAIVEKQKQTDKNKYLLLFAAIVLLVFGLYAAGLFEGKSTRLKRKITENRGEGIADSVCMESYTEFLAGKWRDYTISVIRTMVQADMQHGRISQVPPLDDAQVSFAEILRKNAIEQGILEPSSDVENSVLAGGCLAHFQSITETLKKQYRPGSLLAMCEDHADTRTLILFASGLQSPFIARRHNKFDDLYRIPTVDEFRGRIAEHAEAMADEHGMPAPVNVLFCEGIAEEQPQTAARDSRSKTVNTGRPESEAQCRQYANMAVRQYREAVELPGCAVPTSPRWQDDFDNHYGWCLNAEASVLRREENARQAFIDRCSR